MGDLSAHFDSSEFRDRRDGTYIAPPLALLWILEDLRKQIGRPIPIISGTRSAATNKAVGGAPRSYHLRGRAADIPAGLVRVDQARSAGAGGIGVRDGWVVHVDDRRVARPVIWHYR